MTDIGPDRHHCEGHQAAKTESRELAKTVADFADQRTHKDRAEPCDEID